MAFKFRESEREQITILLGEFGILVHDNQPKSELLERFIAAGMVTRQPMFDDMPESDLVSYFLTDEAKAQIRQALG